MSQKIHILLGGNEGDVKYTFRQAIKKIEESIGHVVKKSSLYQTQAWGVENQPDYLNRVLIVETNLSPQFVLQQCLAIERNFGRVRTKKYASRNIDIDILFFGKQIIDTPTLTVPHPQIPNRKFVLVPLNELSYSKKHPVLKKTIHHLLTICTDTLTVHKIEG